MLQMMLRPRWVLALLAALGIAAGFALLGQWQLDRAVQAGRRPGAAPRRRFARSTTSRSPTVRPSRRRPGSASR